MADIQKWPYSNVSSMGMLKKAASLRQGYGRQASGVLWGHEA